MNKKSQQPFFIFSKFEFSVFGNFEKIGNKFAKIIGNMEFCLYSSCIPQYYHSDHPASYNIKIYLETGGGHITATKLKFHG